MAKFEPNNDALFGGISGLILPNSEFQVRPGLTLASTYAHIMAPYIIAFVRPKNKTAPHPGPWTSIRAEGFDILAEVRLEAGCAPLGFDRLNTLWFVVALLRLRLARPLQLSVLADRSLGLVAADAVGSKLMPVELAQPLLVPATRPTEDELAWVSRHIIAADRLMTLPAFNRAFQTLDRAVAIDNPGAGIVIAWAAIETLLRPGSQKITERVSRGLAAYIHPPGSARDRAFGEIVKSYEARGGAAHAGIQPEEKQYRTAFQFARAALSTAIEHGELPNIESLLGSGLID